MASQFGSISIDNSTPAPTSQFGGTPISASSQLQGYHFEPVADPARPGQTQLVPDAPSTDGKQIPPEYQGDFLQSASNVMGVPALRAGLTRLPLGIMQAESEGLSKGANAIGLPDTAAALQNTADLMRQEAASEQTNAEANKTRAPVMATAANIIPQIGQLAGVGASLPGVIAGGFAAGAAAPKLTPEQQAQIQPANTVTDQVMNAVGYLPEKAVTAAANAVGISPDSRFAKGIEGGLTGAEGYGIAKAIPAVADSAISGVAQRIKGFKADSVEDLKSNIDNNYNTASQTINNAHAQGAALTPAAAQSISDAVDQTLKDNRFNPNKHADTAADVTAFKSKVASGNLTLQDVDDFRKDLGDTISDNNKFKGKAADGYQAVQVKNALLDNISNLGDNSFTQGGAQSVADLRTGINQYAQAARYEKVANIAKNADGDSNAFARGLKNFTKNDKNSKGFSADEWQALKDASSKGIGGSIENWLGKFGIDANRAVAPIAMSAAKIGVAGATTPFIPGGVPLVAAGTLARATSKLATRGGYQNALDLIMNRNTEVMPPNPQITNMRARINADYNGLPRAMTPDEINAANAQREQMANIGLTPDVLKAQRDAQVGNAYDSKAAIQTAFDQAQQKALEQAYVEHQIMEAQPNSAMMQALQKAFNQKKLNAK